MEIIELLLIIVGCLALVVAIATAIIKVSSFYRTQFGFSVWSILTSFNKSVVGNGIYVQFHFMFLAEAFHFAQKGQYMRWNAVNIQRNQKDHVIRMDDLLENFFVVAFCS